MKLKGTWYWPGASCVGGGDVVGGGGDDVIETTAKGMLASVHVCTRAYLPVLRGHERHCHVKKGDLVLVRPLPVLHVMRGGWEQLWFVMGIDWIGRE